MVSYLHENEYLTFYNHDMKVNPYRYNEHVGHDPVAPQTGRVTLLTGRARSFCIVSKAV